MTVFPHPHNLPYTKSLPTTGALKLSLSLTPFFSHWYIRLHSAPSNSNTHKNIIRTLNPLKLDIIQKETKKRKKKKKKKKC